MKINLLLAAALSAILTGGCASYNPHKGVAIQTVQVSEAESHTKGVLPGPGASKTPDQSAHGVKGGAFERSETIAVIGSPQGPVIVRGSKPATDEKRKPLFPDWNTLQKQYQAPASTCPHQPQCTGTCKLRIKFNWLKSGHRLPGDDLRPSQLPDRPRTNHETLVDIPMVGYYFHHDEGSSLNANTSWGPYGPNDSVNGQEWNRTTKQVTPVQYGGYYGTVTVPAPTYYGGGGGGGVTVGSYTTVGR